VDRIFYTIIIFACITTCLFVPSCRKKVNEESSAGNSQNIVVNDGNISQKDRVKNQEPISESNSVTNTDLFDKTGVFDEALELWSKGERESVVDKFLNVKWESATLFSQESPLNLTEKKFIELPESERKIIQQKSLEEAKAIKDMGKYILELGKKSLAVKDYDMAESYFNSFLRYNEALSRAGSLEIIRTLGISGQRAALKGLIELYNKTGNKMKLKAAEERLSQL